MTDAPRFQLNDQPRSLADADPRESLLRWLQRQRLHATKEGCADGDCGACSVLLLEPDGAGRGRLVAVNSCLLPVGALPGRTVYTVEALAADGALHPVQQALVEHGGSQCGYCTPGFVISLTAGFYEGSLGDDCLEGNLCRCTGYRPIRAAAAQLQTIPPLEDSLAAQRRQPRPALAAAQHAGFHSPTTLAQALELKQRQPQARWIAGATDLGVELSHGRPLGESFIALDRIDELQRLEIGEASVRIGAGLPLQRLQDALQGVLPAFEQMLPWFAARQVRNRATLGGNLGTASPIGDLLPPLLALDAEIELCGQAGRRRLPAAGFFTGYRQTARAADELIVAIDFPRRNDVISASYKVCKRQTDDISIVAASFALALDADQCVQQARLAFGGVAATPCRAGAVEAVLSGRRLDRALVYEAALALRAAFSPLDDHRGSADYRRQLCGNLFLRFADEQLGVRP